MSNLILPPGVAPPTPVLEIPDDIQASVDMLILAAERGLLMVARKTTDDGSGTTHFHLCVPSRTDGLKAVAIMVPQLTQEPNEPAEPAAAVPAPATVD